MADSPAERAVEDYRSPRRWRFEQCTPNQPPEAGPPRETAIQSKPEMELQSPLQVTLQRLPVPTLPKAAVELDRSIGYSFRL
jgi:hypothetical protein